MYGSGIIDI